MRSTCTAFSGFVSSHGMQPTVPCDGLYVPVGHAVHPLAAAPEKPGSQRQAAMSALPRFDSVVEFAGQSVHAVAAGRL
eukprot:425723-Rhodomonas_salina.2